MLLPVFVVVFVAWLATWIALHWWLAGRVKFDNEQPNPPMPPGDRL